MGRPEELTVAPLGALLRGLLAGSAGTGLMTAYQTLVQSGESEGDEQPTDEEERWQQAPAPARVARRILEGVFQQVAADRIPLLTNATHWLYGTTLGGIYGLVQGTVRANPVAGGLVFGAGAWALSYLQLVPMGIYEAPWRYPAKTLAVDLSYHVVYGAGVAGASDALERLASAAAA
jgi:hypothetical protein